MKTSLFIGNLIGGTVLVACTISPTFVGTSPVPPNTFTKSHLGLDAVTTTTLSEILTLTVSGHKGHVAAVEYVSDTNRVLAVYRDDGYVIGWEIDTASVVVEYALGIISSKALEFGKSGTLLMGATRHVFRPNAFHQTTEYVDAISLWNMDTGELIECYGAACEGALPDTTVGRIGAVIATSGKTILYYSEDAISVSDGAIITINSPDSDYWWNIGAIAYDATHDRYAIVFQEGEIRLSTGNSIFPYRTLVEGKKGDGREIISAEFDLAGRWLAVIRGDRLSVWEIEKKYLYLEENVQNAVTLSFDQIGELLIVGADDKIMIWDLDSKSKVAQYDAPGITSLDISDDNRLLIWGDKQGHVHIWGVPSP